MSTTVGLILITTAYCRIYLVVRYHQNQIHGQNQIKNDQAMPAAREKKSALNAFYVYIVSLVCFTPNLFAGILLEVDNFQHAYFVSIQWFCIFSFDEFIFKPTCLLLAISGDSRFALLRK